MSDNRYQREYAGSIKNCNVCVVGGAGFLGSHLVAHLVEDRNCNVTVLDNLVSGKRGFIHPEAKFIHHDITSDETLTLQLLKMCKPEWLFNYAACPYVPISYQRPLYVTNVNAFGAMKLINAAHEYGVEGILQVSSAELYGQPMATVGYSAWTSLNENAIVMPHSTYGSSKAMVDFYVQARWREATTPAIALRQFNCIGERETHPYVITEILTQLCHGSNGPKVHLGNDSRRDFMHAKDAVRSAVLLLESGRFGEVYNLGSTTSIQVYDLARLAAQVVGAGHIVVEQDPVKVRPWEIWHLQSDNTKIERVIGKANTYTLEQAIAACHNNYRLNNYQWAWEQ